MKTPPTSTGARTKAQDEPSTLHDGSPKETGVSPGAQHTLFEKVDSTAEGVRHVLLRVAADLQRLGISEADREAIEVVLAECMNNVVEHAYDENPGGSFDLKLFVAGDNIFCRVEDRGAPMPGLILPTSKEHDLSVDLDDLPEGGFGWFLIRELASDLRYARENDRNSLSFQIPLGSH